MNNNFNELNMPNEQKQPEKTPNESGGFHVEGHIKIFDPETVSSTGQYYPQSKIMNFGLTATF